MTAIPSLSLSKTAFPPFMVDNGKVMLQAVTTEAVKKQLAALIGYYMGGPAAIALEFTFPYLSDTVQKVAAGASCTSLVQDYYSAQTDFKQSITVLINRSAKELVVLHAGYYAKKMSLDWVCQTVSQLSKESLGKWLAVAVTPIVAPSVSPLTSNAARSLVKVATIVGQQAITSLQAKSDKEEVELTDFHINEEEYVFVEK